MSVGVDPSGRAFRWKIDTDGEVKTAFAVMGCPPLDDDEVVTWSDPYAFRPQICNRTLHGQKQVLPAKLISADVEWRELVKGNDCGKHARNIVDALKVHQRCPPSQCSGNLALAIPNMLREDAQDALLRELGSAGFPTPALLWRPVAIMLHWLSTLKNARSEYEHGAGSNHVWVLDLDSAGVEATRMGWKPHATTNSWIAPVRSGAPADTEGYDRRVRFNSIAWSEIFINVSECHQLRFAQQAAQVQERLESREQGFDSWLLEHGRWKKVTITKPMLLHATWTRLREQLNALAGNIPVQNDIILIHGWLARMYPEGIKSTITAQWPGTSVHLMPADSVAAGAQLFAQRRWEDLPTYYDTLPEYCIWTNHGWKTFVAQNQEVEPGRPWRLQDEQLRNAFKISPYRQNLSLLVQRNPPEDPANDFARRLRVGLSQMPMQAIPLCIDAEVHPAQGNARFTINAVGEDPPFVQDRQHLTRTVSLSYGLKPREGAVGTETLPEPEHKGYLEAQPVIGRIYDDRAHLTMLRLLVQCWGAEVKAADQVTLGHAVRGYRTDLGLGHLWANVPACTLDALDRWGWVGAGNPANKPTRGLFGTNVIPNRDISELALTLSRLLWPNMPPAGNRDDRNNWANRQNYCHVFASNEYKEHVRNVLTTGVDFSSYAEAHAAGYVLGDDLRDATLLANYVVPAGASPAHVAINWWAFFRMLCWHKEVTLDEPSVTGFLGRLATYIETHALVGNERKYAAFAILFALRVRENTPAYLNAPDAFRLRMEALFNVKLAGIPFPKSMVPLMAGVMGNFSAYVLRFIRKQDTVEDRELGSAIATSD
jgi:hypothetical protein